MLLHKAPAANCPHHSRLSAGSFALLYEAEWKTRRSITTIIAPDEPDAPKKVGANFCGVALAGRLCNGHAGVWLRAVHSPAPGSLMHGLQYLPRLTRSQYLTLIPHL